MRNRFFHRPEYPFAGSEEASLGAFVFTQAE